MSFDVLTVQQLRHRQADIPLLVLHFGRAMARELDWEAFRGLPRKRGIRYKITTGWAMSGNLRTWSRGPSICMVILKDHYPKLPPDSKAHRLSQQLDL